MVELLPSPDLDLGAAERKRAAQRAKLDRELELLERKLANPGFLEKAPGKVVDKARTDRERLLAELDAL